MKNAVILMLRHVGDALGYSTLNVLKASVVIGPILGRKSKSMLVEAKEF